MAEPVSATPFPPITVDLGLVQRDPITLLAGELARADNSYYKINNPTLWKGLGRLAFNSTPEALPITGLRALSFDGTPGYFVAMVGTTYRKSTIAATGTFATFGSPLASTATTLDSIHFENQHVLVDGVDRNQVARSDGTTILHGMLAANLAPALAATGGVGSGFTLSSGKTITYWIEERYKEGSVVVKRSASDATTTVLLTGTGGVVKPRIALPLLRNSDATHWAVFATATNGAFPVGAEIGEVAVSIPTIEDTRVSTDPAIPSGALYQIYSTTDIFGIVQTTARNGAPPISYTGDIMDDCLVMPDAADHSQLRFSLPGKIHQFPSQNVIKFETKEEDEIKGFKYTGSVGVVLLRDSAWVVNTLPQADDATFQPNRVKKQIDGAFGCVGPKAFALFSFGDGALLAYVSPEGVVWTDTRSWSVVTDDLDWPNLIEPAYLKNAVLTNNPFYFRLELRYTPKGGTRNTKVLLLHYHPSHIKRALANQFQFRPNSERTKVSGPLDLPANDACVTLLNGKRVVFTANQDGKVYQEDVGYSFDSGETPTMVVLTRDEYMAGIGAENHIRNILVHHPAAPGEVATVRMVQHVHGQTDQPTVVQIPLDFREATPTFGQAMADGFQFGFESTSTTSEIGVTLFAPIFTPSQLEGV